jgi:peptide/nickel transport system permease protein
LQQYILQRLLLNIPVIFIVITIVFMAGHARPDFAEQAVAGGLTGAGGYEEAVQAARHQLGTDKPLWNQYVDYIKDLARGDFGTSLQTKESVTAELTDRLPASIELGLMQIAIGLMLAVPIGVISAVRQDTWIDYGLRIFAILGLAIPAFFLGPLLIYFSSKIVGWTPPLVNTSYRELWQDPQENLKMMALPALAGGVAEAAVIVRLLRSQMLEVLRQDYVRTAWAKGLRERAVVMRHALRNALIPVVTILGISIGVLFGGNVVLESIFGIPGAGQFIVVSMRQNDFPMVQGVILVVTLALVLTNLVVDLTYAWLDPRIRFG